jgi:hypothetical protein
MIVKLGKDGLLILEQIFTKQFINKIGSYSLDKSEKSIRIQFYDKKGKELKAKLRGKAKKA